MKILLGHSYFLRFDPKLEEAMQPYPPLGTLLVAAQLRDAGHDVVLFDAMLEASEQGWLESLERDQPDLAVLFEDNFNYLSKMCLLNMRDAAHRMLAAADSRDVPAFVCGSDASDQPALYLDAGAKVVLIGEGDATLTELCEHVAALGPAALTPDLLAATAAVAYREQSGELTLTGDRRNLRALDDLPFPAWDLVDIDRYRTVWNDRHGMFSWNVVTTRGCPYHCNWCAKPIWGQRYNARSAESVVAELRLLHESVRPDHIWFADDIFGLKPGWISAFADLAEASDLALRFKCLSRPDLLTKGETAADLARAGCEVVWIGAESGSQQVLDAMEKGTTVGQIQEAADLVHANGFKIGFFLQFGYPGERLADIEATLALVWRARPDDIGMSVSYPLPGTKFHERVLAQLGSVRNWTDSDDLAMLFEGPYSTDFYRRLHVRLHREYRVRQTWWELRAGNMPSPRRVLGTLRDLTLLPIERSRLKREAARAESESGPILEQLPVELTPMDAATPSPQMVDPPKRRARPGGPTGD